MTFFDEVKLYIPLTEPFNKNGLIEESKQYGFLIKTDETKSWAINKIKELRKDYKKFSFEKNKVHISYDPNYVIIEFLMREFEITEDDLK